MLYDAHKFVCHNDLTLQLHSVLLFSAHPEDWTNRKTITNGYILTSKLPIIKIENECLVIANGIRVTSASVTIHSSHSSEVACMPFWRLISYRKRSKLRATLRSVFDFSILLIFISITFSNKTLP